MIGAKFQTYVTNREIAFALFSGNDRTKIVRRGRHPPCHPVLDLPPNFFTAFLPICGALDSLERVRQKRL